MSTYFFSLTRRPFSSPRDPGFLRSMAPTIVESQKRYRRDTLRSFQRGSILALVALVVFASSYPTAFVTAATENATSRASVPLREWGMKDGSSYVQGEVVVKFREGNIDLGEARGVRDARTFAARKRLVVKEMIEGENVGVLKTQDAESVPETIARLEQDPEVAAVQPNFQYRSRTIGTDDTYRDQLWGLDNTGQNVDGASGTADADIDAPEAWAISEGSSDIIAAVIDTGVAYNHPDLLPNMWDGTECKDENGDPLGGCNHGYDYEDGDLTPLPMWSEHGTHISGTIAAVKNNGKGIIGVAPHTKIMALKSGLSTSDNVKSINFAKQNGAKVINASWGMSSNTCDDVFDPLLYQAIQDFPGLFIAASGNSSEEHNGTTYVDMPSDYGHTTSCWTGLPNVINVAAVNSNDNRAVFSDYGAEFVDVGAPGQDIYSTVFASQEVTTPIATENFESATPPAAPNGWTPSGENNTWGTEVVNNSNVLSSALTRLPYVDNADTKLLSPVYDLHGLASADMDFDVRCETEYTDASSTDYLALEMSPDGVTFTEIVRLDEYIIDAMLSDDTDPNNAPLFENIGGPIYSEFLTNTFQYRFRWVTNGTDNNHEGCSVDNIQIQSTTVTIGDGSEEAYDYMSGTSMAAPHVVGLAALIWEYHPELTIAQVKNIILQTGDLNDTLKGKTTSGRRINAYNALRAFQLAGGFTAENVIPAKGGIDHVFNGSGSIGVNFRVRGWEAGRSVTLSNFEYSTDDGVTWAAPANGDASSALMPFPYPFVPPSSPGIPPSVAVPAIPVVPGEATPSSLMGELQPAPVPPGGGSPPSVGVPALPVVPEGGSGGSSSTQNPPEQQPTIVSWQDNGYVMSLNFDGPVYTFPFNTKHQDVQGLANASQDDVKIRFKVNDGETASAFVETERFAIDNVPPVITLLGDEHVTLALGETYTDAGATASDDVDGDITASILTFIGNPVNVNMVGTYTITYHVSDAAGNTTKVKRRVKVLPAITADKIVLAPEMTLDIAKQSIVIGVGDVANAVVSVPADVMNAHLDMTTLVEQLDETTKGATIAGSITVNAATSIGNVQMQMPEAMEMFGPLAWTGIVNTPQVQETSSVTLPSAEGKSSIASAVIEVGAGSIPLTLSKAARLVIPNQAGKRASYERDSLFTAIDTKCSADTQVAGDALPDGGDCIIDVGSDMVIWTKHFTRFVAYQLAGRTHVVENPLYESLGIAFAEGATTEQRDVTLTLTYGEDVTEMAVSNFSDFRGASFEPATHRRTWTLDEGNGEKTVYVLFRNDDGGSTAKNAHITLAPRVVVTGSGSGLPFSPAASVSAPVIVPVPEPQLPPQPVTPPPVVLAPTPRVLGVESTNIVALEKQRVTSVDRQLSVRMKGKVLASADVPGIMWYVDPLSLQKFAISNNTTAFRALRKFGLGITNVDLAKIPVSTNATAKAGVFSRRLLGRILIQVESHGEAWYVNPEDGKRYYVANGAEAYQLMQSLRKDLPTADFRKISVGDLG